MRELKDDVLPPDEDPKSVKSKRSKKRSGTALPKYSYFCKFCFRQRRIQNPGKHLKIKLFAKIFDG